MSLFYLNLVAWNFVIVYLYFTSIWMKCYALMFYLFVKLLEYDWLKDHIHCKNLNANSCRALLFLIPKELTDFSILMDLTMTKVFWQQSMQGLTWYIKPCFKSYFVFAWVIFVLTVLDFLQVMVPFRYQLFLDHLKYLVESGNIPMTRIDDAVERILRVKFVSGAFENPLSDRSLLDTVGCHVSPSCPFWQILAKYLSWILTLNKTFISFILFCLLSQQQSEHLLHIHDARTSQNDCKHPCWCDIGVGVGSTWDSVNLSWMLWLHLWPRSIDWLANSWDLWVKPYVYKEINFISFNSIPLINRNKYFV